MIPWQDGCREAGIEAPTTDGAETKAERGGPDHETLAVVFALQTWKLYLFKHFDIFTDNQAVVYLRSKPHLNKREARWAEFLAEFNFSIQHIPGRENTADSLSRQSEP